MAIRKPLVLKNNTIEELAVGDSIDASITSALSAKVLIITKTAGETISANKAVRLSDSLTCMLADNSSIMTGTVVGISLNSGNTNDVIQILTFGNIEDPFFNFGLNELIFLGANGNLTNIAPTSGVLTLIGNGLGNGSIFVKIKDLIVL